MIDVRTENFTVAENEHFKLSVIEPKQGYYLLHCNVHSGWTKELYNQMLQWWGDILEEFYINGIDYVFVLLPDYEIKVAKFAVKFGFEPITAHDCVTENGERITFLLYRFPVKKIMEEE
jgi:hypothetical protein